MAITLVVANTADKANAAQWAATHGTYVMLNECRGEVKSWIARRLRAVSTQRAWSRRGSQNVHMWRSDRVRGGLARGQRVLLVGGRKGLGKSRRDKRRRGPTRDGCWQLCAELATSRAVIFVDLHLLARVTTSERWRWPLMRSSLAQLRALLRILMVRYPGVPIVVGGDGNLPKLNQWRLGKGWRVVATPADFGRRHYTQVYVHGPAVITGVSEHNTSSDHDALAMTVVLTEDAPELELR